MKAMALGALNFLLLVAAMMIAAWFAVGGIGLVRLGWTAWTGGGCR